MVAVTLTGGLALWFKKRGAERDNLKLRYFTRDEFGPYWHLMSVDLLLMVDEFRHQLGYPVSISKAVGAIGRPVIDGDENSEDGAEKSYHNYLIHGEIMALDLMPSPIFGATQEERRRWLTIAERVGFTGVGIYPDWRPRAGLHVDVRPKSATQNGRIATWSGVLSAPDENGKRKQVYGAIERGFV